MCGIVFLYDPARGREGVAARCRAAIQAMAHRGPDGIDTAGDEHWHMGHSRLAIIGISDGQQPMSDASGRWTIVYNGEIYNYAELRAELASRWAFRTHSDSEVLLAGMALDGERFLARLNGMWAFALWDRVERTLLLARDRLGKKPLYLRSDRDRFACASELPALRTLTGVAPAVDLDSLADTLRYGCTLPGHTIDQGSSEVLPGHLMRWQPGMLARQQPYWSLPQQPSVAPGDGARVLELLESAVRYRLVADVEVGAFLSGGVDSSLVSALAARHTEHKLRTFSIGFADASYDESDYAARMARFLGTDHETAVYAGTDRADMLRLLVQHVGMPFGDASLLPTAAVSALAARRVKVALSGDGADELFGGYQRYLGRVLLRWYSRLPRPVQRGAESLLRALPEPLQHHSRSLLKKAQLFVRNAALARGESEARYVAPRFFSEAELARLAPGLAGRGHASPALPEWVRGDDVLAMMCADALVYLPQDILVKTDRASMAHSLEQRCPFLDYRLIELALSGGSAQHFRGLRGKALLRKAVDSLAPPWLWRRRKQGFAVPLGAWFRGELADDLLSGLRCSGQDWVDTSAVQQLVEAHRQGGVDHGQRLWLLWTYAIWINTSAAPSLAAPSREVA
ncbi:MAG: asparagine synthase (glutamine-hydrolyzing) [Rhodanobacteraceae bacterium]|nr:asparagine synthase (glutamine-hydrolyzing) [Rhodanobacteraceae bacterium]